MKRIILLATGTILSLSAWAPAQEESNAARANALYRQGLLAMQEGQTGTAQACFEGVLELQPSNANARYQLKQLTLQGNRLGAKRRELMLTKVVLPKVEFEDVSLPEALAAITAVVQKETTGKFAPNFVVDDPDGVLQERKITLKLGAVPASVALKYALESARATVRYDEHAIVVRPIGKGSGAPAPKDPLLEDEAPKAPADPFAK